MPSAECREKKIESFQDLLVWQRAMQLAGRIYDVTQSFPKEELFSLVSQIRRASVSVASNIAEGSQRGSRKEFAQFLSIARGSLAELTTQLILAHQRGFISNTDFDDIHGLTDEVSRMSMRLLQSLKQDL